MRRLVFSVLLLAGLEALGSRSVSAQEGPVSQALICGSSALPFVPSSSEASSAAETEVTAECSTLLTSDPGEPPQWRTVWGLVGLRAIPAGAKVAPNGLEYHPNFSIDGEVDFWVWRNQGLYLFADTRLWGQKAEFGVTNAKDGVFATSKRQYDLSGGAAWHYAGPWELRAFGYTYNNLNRGSSQVTPSGFGDGFGLENRYYLSSEYSRLGQTGFDVTKATFLSIGYLPSKVMIGNDGVQFQPGLMLRAYLTCDLWDWPCYLFGDVTYISESSFTPRLFLFDVGVAVRPLEICRQWELRIGAENTADVQVRDMYSLWYVSVRFIF